MGNISIKEKTIFKWLFPDLFATESIICGRWLYLVKIEELFINNKEALKQWISDNPIPQIHFLDSANKDAMNMIIENIKARELQGFSDIQALDMFFRWFLHGVGHSGYEDISDIPDDINKTWYENFKPQLLLALPYDYFGELLVGSSIGKKEAFFPTPMTIVKFMVNVTIREDSHIYDKFDDPCMGTGRMGMIASNHSLAIYGTELSNIIYEAALVNMYLYVPWAVKTTNNLKNALEYLQSID